MSGRLDPAQLFLAFRVSQITTHVFLDIRPLSLSAEQGLDGSAKELASRFFGGFSLGVDCFEVAVGEANRDFRQRHPSSIQQSHQSMADGVEPPHDAGWSVFVRLSFSATRYWRGSCRRRTVSGASLPTNPVHAVLRRRDGYVFTGPWGTAAEAPGANRAAFSI